MMGMIKGDESARYPIHHQRSSPIPITRFHHPLDNQGLRA
jgi:hypothetical protein